MNEIQRHFLGWEAPFLCGASKWLQENYLQGELGTAMDCVVVVPSSEVARRLQTLLVEGAHEIGRAIDLPEIVTTSSLLHVLHDYRKNIASSALLTLSTAIVMREFSSPELLPILGTSQAEQQDFAFWIAHAKEVNTIAGEIMSGGWSVDPSTWPEEAGALLTSKMHAKFAAIHRIRCAVESLLENENTCSRDQAWLDIVESNCEVPKDIVLFATPDLHAVVRRAVGNIATKGARVQCVVRAPESRAEFFDEIGCVIPQMWEKERIEIPEDSIEVAGSPSNQAIALLKGLASLDGAYSKDEITIAITSEDSIGLIRRQLDGHGIETRYAGGAPMFQSPELKLLEALHEFVHTSSFSAYAELVRHPLVSSTFNISSSDLHYLDKFYENHLPSFVGKNWFTPKGLSKYVKVKPLIAMHAKVYPWVAPLFQRDALGLYQSVDLVRMFLLELYGEHELKRRSTRLAALTSIFTALDLLSSLPVSLAEKMGEVSPAHVLNLVLADARSASIPEYPNESAIEVVGWLESMLEDSPCLFVLGMDSSLVSSTSIGHPSIPGQLRQALGIQTMERQLARDAHAVVAMQRERSKIGTLRWIIARKSASGDALSPSQLLLRCKDDDELATRSTKLIVEIGTETPHVPDDFLSGPTSSSIPILKIPTLEMVNAPPLDRLSVTAFKNYLACPYRFWLRRVLQIDEEKDILSELDYALFGTLVHGALELFGKDELIRNSTSASDIGDFLASAADDAVVKFFGKYPYDTIKVQSEMAKHRLRFFASEQASHVLEGWKIIETERKIEWEVGTETDSFIVVGTIDRIDQHSDGRIQVLDYKTGSKTAKSVHGTRDDWKDLQLPIYRHLADYIGYPMDKIETGYVLIGNKENVVKFDFPDWDTDVLAGADGLMWQIIEQVKSGDYERQPASPAPPYCEDLSWICQDGGVIHELDGSGT